MQQNPFTFLGQAISQLLSSHSAALQATGLDSLFVRVSQCRWDHPAALPFG